jgi:hypothetical protein
MARKCRITPARRPGWRVKDRSLAGLRLVGRRADAEGLGVGTLVAVRTADFDDWMRGVVRRVRRGDGDALELGVSLLVERALPVTLHARRPASGDLAFDVDGVRATDTLGRFAGLYLIPLAPPEARPPLRTLIIPASEHFEGRSLFLATARSSYAVTLRQLVDRDADWCRVAIQVTARSGRRAATGGARGPGSVQPLPRLARGVGHDAAATARATAGRGAAAVLPEAIDQNGRHRELLDQALPLFVAVDPLGEVVVVLAERERLDREDPVARLLGIVEGLPFVVAQLAGHEALAPGGAFGGAARRRAGPKRRASA